MNRLQDKYQTSVRTELANKFGYKSSMQIPKIEKIVINMGCGDAVANEKVFVIFSPFIYLILDTMKSGILFGCKSAPI